jgi:hypothetical protein
VAALEERHADEGLERLDLAADGRLGEEELGGARVKDRCRAAASNPRRNSSGGKLRCELAMRPAHGRNAPFSFVGEARKRHSACTERIHQQENDMQLQLKTPTSPSNRAGGDARRCPGHAHRDAHRSVWVTEEGDEHDHVVGPGEALMVARNGRTIVQALKPSWISLADGPGAANDPQE